jgi:hypothetical protein
VGVGNLLVDLERFTQIDVFDTEQSYLDNIDPSSKIMKRCDDFLTWNFDTKYDNIIMNPPYIKIQDLSSEYRIFLKNAFPLLRGNFDIFLAFILKSLELLEDDGICVSINPSSILYNNSSKPVMEYLIKNRYIKEIIDFGSVKIFDNINVYCCIMVFDKSDKKSIIYSSGSGGNTEEINYVGLSNSIFLTHDLNLTIEPHIKNISGIATLCDKVYIHSKKLFDEPCWKPIFKVSKNTFYWIIFPYRDNKIIEETEFRLENEETWKFLNENRDVLSKRDKGKKKYETWYAYGRKQGIKEYNEECIFIPTMGNIDFPIYIGEFVLFYSGIGLLSSHGDEEGSILSLAEIKNNIDKPYNRQLLFTISSKRGSDWMNISSSNIKELKILL